MAEGVVAQQEKAMADLLLHVLPIFFRHVNRNKLLKNGFEKGPSWAFAELRVSWPDGEPR